MSKEESPISSQSSPEPVELTEKKRKRSKAPPTEELAIDINLPEPPSKKAKRAEKKKKDKGVTSKSDNEPTSGATGAEKDHVENKADTTNATGEAKRSEYGIWIGNLPFAATKESLRTFLLDHGNIDEKDITRLHMPGPAGKSDRPGPKPQNRGFAYIDFTTETILDAALALSEKLLVGRRVLIKNAKSFEGRPDKPKPSETADGAEPEPASRKTATKRVFVGNLSFDVTKEELHEHFTQAGEVEDVHMATFEDSGKCKGFAWVRFVEVEAAEAAVRGFVFKDMRKDDDDDEDDEDNSDSGSGDEESKPSKKKKEKKRKWFINRLHARPLRCEFAEDAQTRYKKRFGKESAGRNDNRSAPFVPGAKDAEDINFDGDSQQRRPRLDKDQRQAQRRAKHDARKIAPGQANANAQRATGAIVEGKGTKVTFD